MNIKEIYDEFINLINDNKDKINRVLFVSSATIILSIVFYFSSDSFSINKEVNTLLAYIDDRQYASAENYYDDVEKEFSSSKMNRYNKKVSSKLSSLIINKGDMYISGKITKEQYMGVINISNSLNDINIDLGNMISLGKRVNDMYKEENISYDIASTFLQVTSSLHGIDKNLDEYKQNIKIIYESRKIYKEATKQQSIKKYHEAIKSYDKVIKEDEKYYSYAQNAKKECINVMYDYYISQAKGFEQEGKYEEALKHISYLEPYYEDEEIALLEEKYNENILSYTMTSNDIISLVSRRSNERKENLSVTSYLQTINGKRYYYGEIIKNENVIDEVLIDTQTKDIYSYKSDKKNYNSNYSDAHFMIDENSGEIILSSKKEEAKSILQSKFEESKREVKDIKLLNSDEKQRYINSTLENMINQNGDIYYYFETKWGWFRPKEIYIMNIYDKTFYKVEGDEVINF